MKYERWIMCSWGRVSAIQVDKLCDSIAQWFCNCEESHPDEPGESTVDHLRFACDFHRSWGKMILKGM